MSTLSQSAPYPLEKPSQHKSTHDHQAERPVKEMKAHMAAASLAIALQILQVLSAF